MVNLIKIRKPTGKHSHQAPALHGLTVAMYDSATDELMYMASDHLTSASLILTDEGGLLSQQRYMPEHSPSVYVMEFAKQTPRHKASAVAGYTGQRNYGDFGLMDYNARFYSPKLGRFIQSDTYISNPYDSQGYDRYQYVRNNPCNGIDPTGHFTCSMKFDKPTQTDNSTSTNSTSGQDSSTSTNQQTTHYHKSNGKFSYTPESSNSGCSGWISYLLNELKRTSTGLKLYDMFTNYDNQ